MKVGKVISTNLSRNSGIPKYEKEFIEIYKFGVKGDYHSGKVNFHANKNNLGRQISIVSNEVLKEINGLIGKKLFPGSLGENILIEGFGYLENFNKGDKLKSTDKIFFNRSSKKEKTQKIQVEYEQDNIIRVMQGLQINYFSKKSQEDFFSKKYKITKLTDRMGMRLEGVKLQNIINKNIKSEGITKGSIQVPGDGQPIILLSDHPTIGGYPKIANVITADYDKLVQKTPGTIIKFKLVNLAVAEKAFQDYVRKF